MTTPSVNTNPRKKILDFKKLSAVQEAKAEDEINTKRNYIDKIKLRNDIIVPINEEEIELKISKVEKSRTPSKISFTDEKHLLAAEKEPQQSSRVIYLENKQQELNN